MSLEAFSCPKCGSSSLEQSSVEDQFACLHCGSTSYYVSSLRILTVSLGTSCPKCAESNSIANRFCSSCGAQLFDTCTFCRSEIPPEQVYCPYCGEFLGGIPFASIGDVRRLVESITSRHRSPIFSSLPTNLDTLDELSGAFGAGEEFLWGFIPPINEQTSRENGYTLYVFVEDVICHGGLFVATSEGFYALAPEIPETRSFLSRKLGRPAVTLSCRYEDIDLFRSSFSLPFPHDIALSIALDYPGDYQSPYPHDLFRIIGEAGEKEQDPLCSGFEIRSALDKTIRLVQLPGSWPRLEEWEKLLRFTLGMKRSDLEYQPGSYCP